MNAYNIAIASAHLKLSPYSTAAIKILLQEDQDHLVEWLLGAKADLANAQGAVDFLVNQRQTIPSDTDPFGYEFAAQPELEQLIARAVAKMEEASASLSAVEAEIAKVADAIVARTAGAASADTGVA